MSQICEVRSTFFVVIRTLDLGVLGIRSPGFWISFCYQYVSHHLGNIYLPSFRCAILDIGVQRMHKMYKVPCLGDRSV